jgi:L-lactate dehydrogenase complex protein LldG
MEGESEVMSSRETILARVRQALADRPVVDPPPVPEVWPETNPDGPTMLARFGEELSAIHGEFHLCGSIKAAGKKLAELLAELGCERLGVVDQPLGRALAERLPKDQVAWVGESWDSRTIAELKASLVAAELLLADTGSCAVRCRTAQERMLCYLPPACIVVGRAEDVREHMPAAWKELAPRLADPELRGETVIITGPSRTADIEKILILGVHGPKRLIVLAVQ